MFAVNSIVHALCLSNCKSKFDAWYGLYNPSEAIEISGIENLTSTNKDQIYWIYIFAETSTFMQLVSYGVMIENLQIFLVGRLL